jgi:hypothetical protein
MFANTQKDIRTLAMGRNGNVVIVDWPTAQRLHAEGRRLVHKPNSLKSFKRDENDDLPPEAA